MKRGFQNDIVVALAFHRKKRWKKNWGVLKHHVYAGNWSAKNRNCLLNSKDQKMCPRN